MTHPRDWDKDRHYPHVDGARCGDRNPSTGCVCTRERGHDRPHARVWLRISPGRAREEW